MFILLWFIIGVIVLGLLLGFVISAAIGSNIANIKNAKREQRLKLRDAKYLVMSLPANLKPKAKETVQNVKKYFIKLGTNKVPIEANEIKKAQKDGYEILIE